MNALELTGQARTHLVERPDLGGALHVHVVRPFLNLQQAALRAGFDLRPVSAFRDFARQLSIWNAKFCGGRALLDSAGGVLDVSRLSPAERIDAILVWSALPGASRHHWGTDLDLIDAKALEPARVQLTAEEFSASGPFGPLSRWLEDHAGRFGFFRPFRGVLSGVQAEPWHCSFAPVAEGARHALKPSILRAALEAAPLMGKEFVMARLDELHARYVTAIDWP